MKRLVVALTLIGLAGVSTIASSQNWNSAQVSSWTPKEITKFLAASPWAGRPDVQRAPHLVASRGEKLMVTWESASHVRLARERAGYQRRFRALPPSTEPTYTVSVRIWGTAVVLDYLNPSLSTYSPEYGVSRVLGPFAALRPDRFALVRSGKPALLPIQSEGFFVNKNGAVTMPLSKDQRTSVDGDLTLDQCGNRINQSRRGDTVFNSPYPADPGIARAHAFDGRLYYDLDGPLACDTSAVVVLEFPATEPLSLDETVEFRATDWLGYRVVSKKFVVRDMAADGSLDLR